MSGDPGRDQPLIFYTDEMTAAKKILLSKSGKEVVEIQGITFQKRWRTGSPMQG